MIKNNKRVIWICDPYSDLPVSSNRLGRYHHIAVYLVAQGFEVHLFISNFSHTFKTYLEIPTYSQIYSGVKYHIVESKSYNSHVSFERIVYERIYAKNMISKWHKLNIKADLIILRDPLIFQMPYLKTYLKNTQIPYLIDIIDLWPELFVSKLPTFLKQFEKTIFSYLYKRRNAYLGRAKLITAVTTDYFKILPDKCSQIPKKVIYWGVDCNKAKIFHLESNSKCDYPKVQTDFWVTYTGTLGINYDIAIILNAAKELREYSNIKFIIAGKGPLEEYIKSTISEYALKNVFYFGFISQEQLFHLLRQSDLGLLTYTKDSTVTMPIKAYDYLAAGLPILNCLNGEIGELIAINNLGLNYRAEDVYSFVEAIKDAFQNRNKLSALRVEIRKFSKSFDIDLQYGEMAKFISDNL